ncbi:mavicyanin-like [Canna indica]|uniref:Mavicyanin-like n=1 Tax=Canna indica TaxID=4628 RepID=A0AAQ3Q6W8_9LILI|nr:mavicyanin-like [Canna indica]
MEAQAAQQQGAQEVGLRVPGATSSFLVFEYNKNFHNVLEVSKADYSACNAASPIATYTSGNDSITLKNKGHHFFICGFTGHCSGG